MAMGANAVAAGALVLLAVSTWNGLAGDGPRVPQGTKFSPSGPSRAMLCPWP